MGPVKHDMIDEEIINIVRSLVGQGAIITVLREGSRVADGTSIFAVRDYPFECVMLLSPVDYPLVVAESSDRTREFVDAIGLTLSSAVLQPIAEGWQDERSYALLPYRKPVSQQRLLRRYQERLLTPGILDWLARVATKTDDRRDATGDLPTYRTNLAALAATSGIGSEISDAVARAEQSLVSEMVRPWIMPMHGDLWSGNILRAPDRSGFLFSIIDWRGSTITGFPIYDLVRFAQSYRLSPRVLGKELARHAGILGCSKEATLVHLLAALGYYAVNRGEMPLENFVLMCRRSFAAHRAALAAN